MVMVDNHRRFHEVNTAARLLSRLSLQEARRHTIDDFTAVEDWPQMIAAWEALMQDGTVSDPYLLTFQDESKLRILYAAIANALPGLHLIIFLPADWPGDELE
ncbi:MAG: hypothetical protein JO244_04355, partial [Solirubrobacterales bacterium]|nr:hypothetical protein [Solirubrobacterales bacterium]